MQWGRVMWRMVPFAETRAKPYLCRACAVPRVLLGGTIRGRP